jgi:hypothetical protein
MSSENTNTETKLTTQETKTEPEHPTIPLTRKYIDDYEKLMQENENKTVHGPSETIEMLSQLISSIESFIVSYKQEEHKSAQKVLFPDGYKNKSSEIDKFTKEQLLWLMNQCEIDGTTIDPELEDADLLDEVKLSEWFRGHLKKNLICNYCEDLGHQFNSCEKLFLLPCPLCGNEDHFGTECNSVKAKMIRNKNRPPIEKSERGGRGKFNRFRRGRGRGGRSHSGSKTD